MCAANFLKYREFYPNKEFCLLYTHIYILTGLLKHKIYNILCTINIKPLTPKINTKQRTYL